MTVSSPTPVGIPHEFKNHQLIRGPFASHSPAAGWPEQDEIGTIRLKQEYTLIFVVDRVKNKVLLGFKRRGMGVDLYNGFGGKVEKGESIHRCAARELEEESGLVPENEGLYYKGCLFSSRPQSLSVDSKSSVITIHFFACVSWSGEPIMTEEMIPQWFDVPAEDIWPEATFYLLPVLRSILDDHRGDLFLSRINYEYMCLADAPTSLPALDGMTIRQYVTSSIAHEDKKHDFGECLSSWWMCFGSDKSLGPIRNEYGTV
uniref:Nudix hydrolase domain-containing protein n=1 Tax=Kwoniella bestiolae CBS 10118 TaxID=1296100 RepID=A0A1B9G471_9TREE|nr:hypothetical protein I302_03521 [Kwoniella bestiolae CBS 10118]OCF25847.1 hypothetical protein I302_03521 [Kwoniella bestiolae CBS 10118]